MRILILDGNENQSVASVRSLAKAGHTVVVGATTRWSKAGWSRACTGTFRYPAPQESSEAFIRRIIEETQRVPGTVVFPMTERTTLTISANRGDLQAVGGHVVLPTHKNLLRAFDKRYTTKLAKSLGATTPTTILIETEEAAKVVGRNVQYPVVLKPRSSEEVTEAGATVSTGAPHYARSQVEFAQAYAALRRRCSTVLVQEFVAGQGAGYFALMRYGELRAEFAHRRIRDVRPTGSGSAVRVSVRPDPRVREVALAILRALDWHGVAMVEFRIRPDGTPVFLEVNGRFWNSLPLAVYAGVDFPALLARMERDGDVQCVTEYQEGIRCRWLLGDVRHLVEVLRGPPSTFPGSFPSRATTLANFLVPVPGTFHDNFQWRDPLPAFGDWLDVLIRKIPAMFTRHTV